MLRDINDILCLERFSNPHPIAVSSDGNQLAVVTQSHCRKQAIEKADVRLLPTGLLVELEGSEILLINIKSGESRNLTPNWGTSYRPAWSPDGKKLAIRISMEARNCGCGKATKVNPGLLVMSQFDTFRRTVHHPFGPQMGRVLSSSCNLKQG